MQKAPRLRFKDGPYEEQAKGQHGLESKSNELGDFPDGPVLEDLPCNAGTQVQLLMGELRSHMPQGNYAQVPQLYSPCTLEPMSHNEGSQVPQLRTDAVKINK